MMVAGDGYMLLVCVFVCTSEVYVTGSNGCKHYSNSIGDLATYLVFDHCSQSKLVL